ncbi:MAG: NADPH-dependent 2,4-dienoyl-CoA reductase, partial [Pseudomonadota bacterium]
MGGQLNLAKQVPGKEEFHGLVAWFVHETRRLGVETRLGAMVDVADLAGFDQVIVASGVSPRDPQIPGQERAKSYLQVLHGAPIGRRVAIVGAGGIGFDVAEYLVANGHSVTLNPVEWRKEWGVGDPAETAGGLREPAPEPPAREVWLLQRKAEKPGRNLG